MTQTEILAKMQTVFDDVFLDDVKVTPELSANDVGSFRNAGRVGE